MTTEQNDVNIEWRQFGRRQMAQHALIQLGLGQKIPCTISNISQRGALLEFQDIAPPANKFRLIVEQEQFSIDCDVRHRQTHALGVLFVFEEETELPPIIQGGKDLAQRMRWLLSDDY